MALAGHIRDYPLVELLFFLSSKQRTGQLVLKRPETTIIFSLRRGRLIAAQMLPADQRLGDRLVADGVLDTGLLATALEVQCQETRRRPLGTLLVELGHVDRDIIYRALREQIADCLVHFLIAPGGIFRYQEKMIDSSIIDVDVIVEREVLDAIRRADEYVAHQITTGPLSLRTFVSADILQPFINDHWDVIDAMLGGARTVDEIIAATRWTRSRVLDSLFQLQANSVIEFECSLVSTIMA